MTLKVVEPIEITEAVLTASDIPEPDANVGEVEWVDTEKLDFFGSLSGDYRASALAGDGKLYCVGASGDVLKIDPDSDSISTFGSYSGTYLTATTADNGNVYCVGSTGTILKIDIENQTISTFGDHTGIYLSRYNDSVKWLDGKIYCVGIGAESYGGAVLVIDPINETLETFGEYVGELEAMELAGDGSIYCVGRPGEVLKVDPSGRSVSLFGSYSGMCLTATLAGDGNIYCVRAANNITGTCDIMMINVTSQALSYFGDFTLERYGNYFYNFRSSTIASDGNLYCIGDSTTEHPGRVMIVNPTERTSDVFGDGYIGNYKASIMAGNGKIYGVGTSGTGVSGGADEVLVINRGYNPKERAIRVGLHKLYECVIYTRKTPEESVGNIPPEWVEVGPTNRWAMFDDQVSTVTKSSGSFSVELESSNYIMAYGVVGTSGLTSVRCQVYDSGDNLIYDDTQSAFDTVGAPGYFIYASEDVFYKKKLYQTDIPPTENFRAVLTFNGSNIEIGNLTIGPAIELGPCLTDSKNESLDLSEQKFDDFGNETYIERPIVTFATYETISSIENSNIINRFLNVIRRKGCLWIGEVGYNQSIVTFGRIERDPIPYTMPTEIRYTIRVRGFA